ncbi:uncharacterized protein LOC143203496 [Rhynchophorus ferrugineus]|uniref:Chromo domain-containing protein n=1 Tax=Rhynchophorus ferrugineus TaxID=354439 RepID=A0A834I6I1_RHYFE|nr:hypothetical protein GWI33_013699 [Rhynchophorus ferrugineus]
MKRKSGSRKSTKAEENGTGIVQENGGEDASQDKKNKRSRRSKSKNESEVSADDSEADSKLNEETDPLAADEDNSDEYEVETILDDKLVKGIRHFLIRWKGYTEESDTWEPEHTLDCSELITEYKNKKKKQSKKKNERSKKGDDQSQTWDENQDFEVERILDVYFHKDGKRDFLVSWKGYPAAQNSWEPEDNMDCKDLIAKFMAKVEEAKKYESKETKLRPNRKPVERLEFSMHETSRRLSKRYKGRERVHYYNAE